MLSAKDNRLLFFVIFSMFATAYVITKEPVEIYLGYTVLLLLLPVYLMRYGVPSRFWYFFLFFVFTGFFNVLVGNNETGQLMKILIGLLISYLFYYYVLQRFEFDVRVLFKAYMNGAVFVSIIGAIQVVSIVVGFRPGYDYTWTGLFNKWGLSGGEAGLRVNAIFSEPSTYAAIIAPAMFVALYNVVTTKTFMVKRWQSILILVVYFFTFSSVGYIGIFVAIILLMVNYGFGRFILFFLPLLLLAFYVLYNNVEDFRYRLDSTVYLFQTGQVDIGKQHGSAIVFYNNYVVATENFKTNFLFGTGLGSHPYAFDKYSITQNIETFGFANNSSDANSMLLRIISELGILGVIFSFVFLRRNFVRRDAKDPDNIYWILSSATLCIIVLYLLRQGHYFLNGFPFFVWIYFYTRQNANEYAREREEEELEEDEDGEETEEDADEEPVVPQRRF